jgi:hypothetical protein
LLIVETFAVEKGTDKHWPNPPEPAPRDTCILQCSVRAVYAS